MRQEDRGIDRASIYLADGSRLSRSTPIEFIFEDPFTLRINEISYPVQPPAVFASTKPIDETLSDVSNSVTKLYHDLRLNHHIKHREHELERQLDSLRESLRPLNDLHTQLAKKALRRLKVSVELFESRRKTLETCVLEFNGQSWVECLSKQGCSSDSFGSITGNPTRHRRHPFDLFF